MKIRIPFPGVLAAVLVLAAPVTNLWAASRAEVEQALAAAKTALEQATAAGTKGGDAADLIKEATGLIPSRQYTKAIEIANKARKEAEFALSQAAATKPSAGAPGGATTAGTPTPATANKATAAEAEAAIAAAEAARKKADSVGGEWRDTAKMIKDAGDLVKTGEFDAAVKLANKAKRQGEMGYAQAISQKGATFPSYVHPQQK